MAGDMETHGTLVGTAIRGPLTSLIVLAALAPTSTAQTVPNEKPPRSALQREVAFVVTAITQRPVPRGSFKLGGVTWICDGTRCAARGPLPVSELDACRALVGKVGPIRSFSHRRKTLTDEELATCHSTKPAAPEAPSTPVAPPSATVRPPPTQVERSTADFSYEHENLEEGGRPLGVRFQDRSAGAVARRLWDFGDGTRVADDPRPAHLYAREGFYEICLVVEGASSSPLGAPLQSRTCQIIYADPLVQILESFFGPFEQRLGGVAEVAADRYNRLVRVPPFDRLSPSHDAALRWLLADPATRASEIVAFLVRQSYQRYKPFLYFYVGAGADICDLLGQPQCDAGLNAVVYLYIDMIDLTQFLLRFYTGRVVNDPHFNDDQTRSANFLTVVVNVGASLGVGTNPGFGILFVPRPGGEPLGADPDFNRLDPSCGDNVANCVLDWGGSAVTFTATGVGFFAGHDGSLGMETTLWSLEAATQIVRVDLDAAAVMTDAERAMRCALEVYDRAGGLYGSEVDYARALSEAFQVDLLARPPEFALDCGSVNCRGPGCAGDVSSLRGFRDVSWGPPIILLRALAALLPLEVSYVAVGEAGGVGVEGRAGSLLDFDVIFAPRSGGSLALRHEHFSIDVNRIEMVPPLGARLAGDVELHGIELGETMVALHTATPDADWRLRLEGTLLDYIDLVYEYQSPQAEALTVTAGPLSMHVEDVVRVAGGSLTLRGELYWGNTSLGASELVASRDGAIQATLLDYLTLEYRYETPARNTFTIRVGDLSMDVERVVRTSTGDLSFRGDLDWSGFRPGRTDLTAGPGGASARFAVSRAGIPRTRFDGPVKLELSIGVGGSVTLAARTNRTVAGTFRGSVRTTASIHVTGSDLGVDEFDFSRSFDETYENVEVTVDSSGTAGVPYYYPTLQWAGQNFPYPCGTKWCEGTNPVTGEKFGYPCGTRWCDETVQVPVGLTTKSGNLSADLW
jgi:hypothetical protein